MILRSLALAGFGSYATRSVLTLPERGIALVTGPNGSGKSTLIDAVAVGLWGQPMRRRSDGRAWSPWLSKRAGEVLIAAEGFTVTRSRSKGGKVDLSFVQAGVDPVTWESATHAQRALDRIVGPFDVWRRACVFSGADASHLSLASDADRKALIEAMLGLAAFDTAIDDERKVIRTRRDALDRVQASYTNADRYVVSARSAHAEALLAVAELATVALGTGEERAQVAGLVAVYAREGPAGVRAELARSRDLLRAAHAEAQTDAALWREELRVLRSEITGLDAETRELLRRRRVLDESACASCGRAIGAEERTAQIADLDPAIKRVALDLEDARVQRDALTLRVRDLDFVVQDRSEALQREAGRSAQAIAYFERKETVAQCRSAAQVRLDAAAVKMREAEVERGRLEGDVQTAETALATAETAIAALQGTRSAMLARCLGGIERAANAWLGKLGAAYRVELRSTTETKVGAVKDAISIAVNGAGGGQDYGGCSSGERRRIDVALLLALGEVNAAANGGAGGTIFMDEVDGHLDVDGREVFADALRGLARDHAIVVITHSEDFARRLRADVRIRAENGRLV